MEGEVIIKYTLEVVFKMNEDDTDTEELVEDIRQEVEAVIAFFSMTDNPNVKIREGT